MSADYSVICPKCSSEELWVTEYFGIDWNTLKIDGYASGECDTCGYKAAVEVKESEGSEE